MGRRTRRTPPSHIRTPPTYPPCEPTPLSTARAAGLSDGSPISTRRVPNMVAISKTAASCRRSRSSRLSRCCSAAQASLSWLCHRHRQPAPLWTCASDPCPRECSPRGQSSVLRATQRAWKWVQINRSFPLTPTRGQCGQRAPWPAKY